MEKREKLKTKNKETEKYFIIISLADSCNNPINNQTIC